MAIYRFEAKIISRRGSGNGGVSGGRSTVGAASYRTGKCATSAAAYRAAAELVDERTGQRYDYTAKRGVMGAAILLPASAPAWMADRSKLWNAVEKIEKRRDAQLARDFILSLPHELSHAQRVALTVEFVGEQFVAKGFAADLAFHSPEAGGGLNHHAHVMLPMRRVGPDGFSRLKDRPAAGVHPGVAWKAELLALRQAWETAVNRHLAAAGIETRVDRRSLVERGIDRVPQPKCGPVIGDQAARFGGGRGRVSEVRPGRANAGGHRRAGEVVRRVGAPSQAAGVVRPSGGPLLGRAAGSVLEAGIVPGALRERTVERLARAVGVPIAADNAGRPRQGEESGAILAAFRAAGRESTAAPAARQLGPGRRARTGGSGASSPPDGRRRFSARNLAADHVRLCHDPLKNLPRWLAEDKKRAGGAARRSQPPPPAARETAGHDQAGQQTRMAAADRLCRDALQELRGGLDADGQRGWRLDGVPARQGAGARRYDELRPLRGEGRTRSVAAPRRRPAQGWRAAARGVAGRAPAMTVRAGWPDQMKRDLAACRSAADHLAWGVKWADILAGRVLADEQPQKPRWWKYVLRLLGIMSLT